MCVLTLTEDSVHSRNYVDGWINFIGTPHPIHFFLQSTPASFVYIQMELYLVSLLFPKPYFACCTTSYLGRTGIFMLSMDIATVPRVVCDMKICQLFLFPTHNFIVIYRFWNSSENPRKSILWFSVNTIVLSAHSTNNAQSFCVYFAVVQNQKSSSSDWRF